MTAIPLSLHCALLWNPRVRVASTNRPSGDQDGLKYETSARRFPRATIRRLPPSLDMTPMSALNASSVNAIKDPSGETAGIAARSEIRWLCVPSRRICQTES
jgi:hypothetical protein